MLPTGVGRPASQNLGARGPQLHQDPPTCPHTNLGPHSLPTSGPTLTVKACEAGSSTCVVTQPVTG